jgi:thioredoxin-related protein
VKQDLFKRIEVVANVAIIVAAVLLCVVLVKNYLTPNPVSLADVAVTRASNPNNRSSSNIQPGTKLSLAGIDWAKNGQTLLLAISDKCHFCSESAPFYQRLTHDHGKTHLVAVLPQEVQEGKGYLDNLSVKIDDVKQAPLSSMGVRGTPTLILVDSNGTTVKSWVGRLAPNQEAEVLSSLQ